ncbi:hypothetical protein CROQUDRAFT_41173 [Cronartium quercuum f. sp. fusiforme G11]|uniref:DNA primase n=1 Tax=Cronartium quercuum f. sp. fusiforme G11 TaxID=708437 RepID=A0A9P6NS97_9BASI|nr:hypothetical protein CROQUDRAFT_41173 [Cronartium quercuum f. sp. fusiforme G11]
MSNFYRRLFPWKQLFLWLNQDHVPTYAFTHREFAVTLRNDAYLRYNSYANHTELQKDIIRLNPTRFEIGPAYTAQPKDRKLVQKEAFKPILRELVFDIDLTDYDDIRTCCSETRICRKCWKFISIAVEVIEVALRNDFGFKHLLWVYSGRRGIHCWVSDQEALRLSDEQRKAIVNYLDIMRGGGARQGLKVDLRLPLHPSIHRSFTILKVHFIEIALEDQDVFKDPEKWKLLLQIYSELELPRHSIEQTATKSSVEKWNLITKAQPPPPKADPNTKISTKIPIGQQKKINRISETNHNVILHYTYPRIDLEVSKHMNHLLKSPFCVHPGTGKVCVPIDPKRIHEFDPDAVPDVRDLLRELDKVDRATGVADPGTSAQPSWEKTSLKPFVEIYEKHINNVLKEKLQSKKPQAHSMEF